jgi:hypothetical protein
VTPAEALVSAAIATIALVALLLALLSLFAVRAQRRAGKRSSRAGPTAEVRVSRGALQRVGVVRFNPYHDTGGDYSFAVALLDASGNGVVLTGLYHRDRCRVYAKPVGGWESTYELIDEERQAIAEARTGMDMPE